MTTLYRSIILLMRKQIILISLLLALSVCDQEIPYPKREYGFTIGDKYGDVHLEFFIDFACPDSKASYLTLKDVSKSIDFAQQSIKFTYQFIPLQFHFYAFKITQGFFSVWKMGGQNAATKYIDYVFLHQQELAQQAYINSTLQQFLNELATKLAAVTGVNQATLRSQLQTGSQSDTLARYHWKYAVGVHGASGAPIFAVNSVRIDGAENYKYQDWIEFIKKIKS